MELFRLIIKRIKDLLLFSGLITGEEYLIVYDPVTDTSYKVKVSSIRGGQSTLEKWSPDAEYDEGKILEWNLKIWQSLTDNNQGNIPTEGAFWTEVSRSEGGNCGYYAPGVFTNDPTIVLHSGSLYWLDNTVVTLPFNSTDFAAELAANKWKSITGSGGGGLTPEQEEVLDDAEAHIDGADEAKHGSEQIINAAALANIETAANAKVSEILAAINSKIASFVDLSEIDVSDINVGEKKIIVAIKNSEGVAEFGGAIGLLDAIANPGVEGLLGETAAWIADEITLTGNNLNGQLGENSQIFPGVFDFYVCTTHNNGTTTSNGSATWRRYRSMDCLNILVAQHATIVGQLETEAGWNAGAQFKQIAAKSKRGTWFRRTTGGYLFMCIDDNNGWTRIGTPPTISLEITAASHPNLTTSLNAHDFTANRFYVEGTNATDEAAGQGQQYWNTTTKNVFQRDMLGNWAKLN